MDWQRTLLISGMAITAWLLVIQWNNFNDQRVKVVDSFNETVIEQTPYFSNPSRIEADEEFELAVLALPHLGRILSLA